MPRKKNISKEELQNKINELSLDELLEVVKEYGDFNSKDINNLKAKVIQDNFESKLKSLGINSKCPYCNSELIVKHGKQGNLTRFLCKDCNKHFTLFTNTILEKTKYPYEAWVQVLHLTLNNTSIEKIVNILKEDYKLVDIDKRTVLYWRHKLIHSLAEMPMPKLSGIIQIDETFIRESQKGEQELVTYFKDLPRDARWGRRPSKLGSMGTEWCTIVTMVDLKGYVIAKVSGLGKLETDLFYELFDEYIENPQYICTDKNNIYAKYCKAKGYELYMCPSKYLEITKKAGCKYPPKNDLEREENFKICKKLYEKGELDFILDKKDMDYKKFCELKNANSLSLARVNEVHNQIKYTFNRTMRNVSSKYLSDYIGFYVYTRNWRITNGHYPTSLKEAESIFIDILKGHTNYKIKDQKEKKLDLPKPSDKFLKSLKEHTEKMQKKEPYFKYDSEDNIINFNKRTFLYSITKTKLNELRIKYKISKTYAKDGIITELLKQPTIDEDIEDIILNSRAYFMDDEDLAVLKGKGFL